MKRTKFFVILGHFFLPFDPPNPKSQKFEKIKKCLKILSFYTCVPQMTIMMYGFWYIKHDRQNFLSFWAIFCPFTPLTIQKIKFWKNGKSSWRYYHLHKCTINDNHMIYGSWDVNCNRQIFLVIFGYVLPFYPPKMKISQNKKKKNIWRYHHFIQVFQKSWSHAILFVRHGLCWM